MFKFHKGKWHLNYIRPITDPDYEADGQDMSALFDDDTFDRWYCDPPYNEINALKMYGTQMPLRQNLLRC